MMALENAEAKYILDTNCNITFSFSFIDGTNMRQQRIRSHHAQVTKL